jgi:uncharacterized membrane-anchored protein YjiN (DUF445 family)
MVGALADWFAVSALFKRIPIPIVSRHTEIIPANKERIADNLAAFVHEKFLDTESIVRLIQRHDPAQKVADWLLAPGNTKILGDYLVRMGGWALDFIEDAAVQNFIRRAVHGMVGSVDLSKAAGTILESLTRDRRHQELLDEGIRQLARLLDNADTQEVIATGIVDWLREEYAFMEKMLPSELIGRKGADITVRLAAGILKRVATTPGTRCASASTCLPRSSSAPAGRPGVRREGRGNQALPGRRRHPERLPGRCGATSRNGSRPTSKRTTRCCTGAWSPPAPGSAGCWPRTRSCAPR